MDSSLCDPHSADAGAERPVGLAGMSVLVVDDNEISQLIAAGLLTDAGAGVCGVASGAEAVAAVQAKAYDLILMDLQMPGMNGFQTTEEIRGIPNRASVPIVAMTAARAPREERMKCLEAGMDDFVCKPLDVRELVGVLQRSTARSWTVAQIEGVASCISFQDGLRRCLGQVELYDRIAQRFLASRLADAEKTEAAIAAGDHELARKLAHDLTSTAGTLGARRLSDAALALQVGLDDRIDAQELAALLRDYVSEHAAVAAALQSYAAGEVDLTASVQGKQHGG